MLAPYEVVLTGDVCYAGFSQSFGPFPRGTTISISRTSEITGAPCGELVSGSDLTSVISYEDGGGDADFNDVVITVTEVPLRDLHHPPPQTLRSFHLAGRFHLASGACLRVVSRQLVILEASDRTGVMPQVLRGAGA